MMKRFFTLLLALLMLAPAALAENADTAELDDELIVEDVLLTDDGQEIVTQTSVALNPVREEFIDRIVELGHELYIKADGKSQRAHYSGDIYVCKNFTVHLFRKNRDDFRMAEYPDVELVIPNNMPKAKCKPYAYGLMWEDVPASKGNPFYEAAAFRYDPELSKEENFQLACDFMRQAQRGDYFQMSAKYEYGTGAHSAIMLGYDPDTDEIHWMDSNMRGGKKNGIRYGIVQFDEVKSVEWWAKTFCLKTRGATLYRLRDDIIYAE